MKKCLDTKPSYFLALITLLNSKSGEELEELDIEDRTFTILEVRKVVSKKNLILQMETKCNNLENTTQRFHRIFNQLHQKGLPRLQGIGDKMVKREDYQHKLYTIARERSKFAKIEGTLIGKEFMGGLSYDLLIKHEISHLFLSNPTFEKFIEVYEFYRKLIHFKLPNEQRWEKLCELLE